VTQVQTSATRQTCQGAFKVMLMVLTGRNQWDSS